MSKAYCHCHCQHYAQQLPFHYHIKIVTVVCWHCNKEQTLMYFVKEDLCLQDSICGRLLRHLTTAIISQSHLPGGAFRDHWTVCDKMALNLII